MTTVEWDDWALGPNRAYAAVVFARLATMPHDLFQRLVDEDAALRDVARAEQMGLLSTLSRICRESDEVDELDTTACLYGQAVSHIRSLAFDHSEADLTAASMAMRAATLRGIVSPDVYDFLSLPYRCVVGPMYDGDADVEASTLVEWTARRYVEQGLDREAAVVAAALEVGNV